MTPAASSRTTGNTTRAQSPVPSSVQPAPSAPPQSGPEPSTRGTLATTLGLWTLLRKRTDGHFDPQRLTGALASTAFGVSTAVLLLVVGGFGAFWQRSQAPGATDEDGLYILLAGTAAALLLVPIITLGGAAARLAMARRDERLAALRLAGATTSQVSVLTLLDACVQALIGGIGGAVGVFALIPLVLPLSFQGRPFAYTELIPPWWVFPAAVAVVVLVALLSAAASLAKVAITPLGVAARHTPNPLHWSRLIPMALAIVTFAVLVETGGAELSVLVVILAAGFAMISLVGPWVMGMVGRLGVRIARNAPALIAARRIIDDPKGTWRSVGGVALCTFIAGVAAASAMFEPSPDAPAADRYLFADLTTGGFLMLAIAGTLAAVSTGVMGAGRIIDQRGQYRALRMAGTEVAVLHRARWRQIMLPLVAAVVIAIAAAMLFIIPALGFAFATSVPVLVRYLASVVVACGLVLLGTWASSPVVRTVLS